MKRTLSFMVMALALLLTQCRKPEVKFPTPSSAEGVTVSMTVTAGPGSKTDITAAGAITWSENDKLYVGFGGEYVGCLTIVSGQNTPTGWFSGNVTLPTGITEGTPQTFHFFYLGSAERTLEVGATTVNVDFSSQNIYADVNNKADDNKKLVNVSAQHVGYGSANGTVTNGAVTGINVTLVSKVALARFSFTAGTNPYTGELTLSGTHIYNSMTVNFGGTCTPGENGNITLAAGHAERYVMLVPVGTESETLSFAGDVFEGSTTLGSGIEPNKFYGRDGAIEVKPVEFTVGMDGDTPRKVKFAPGNLWYDGSTFHFETNQWDTEPTAVGQTGSTFSWSSSHVSHFKWSPNKDVAVGTSTVSGTTNDVFFTNETPTTANSDFHVNGETGTNQWRMLSNAEWKYLLNTNGSSGRTDDNRFAKAKVNGVRGLLIFPDGYSGTASGDGIATVNTTGAAYPSENIPDGTWTSMETAGVVFLPAAGSRMETNVSSVGSDGRYWSSTQGGENYAYGMGFGSSSVMYPQSGRSFGYSVRLVRSAS